MEGVGSTLVSSDRGSLSEPQSEACMGIRVECLGLRVLGSGLRV